MSERAAQQQSEQLVQQQYVSVERYQKLVAFVNHLVANINELVEKVEWLENHEKTRQRTEDERAKAQKFQWCDAALEAEAGS